jgi:hypothetical protein
MFEICAARHTIVKISIRILEIFAKLEHFLGFEFERSSERSFRQ